MSQLRDAVTTPADERQVMRLFARWLEDVARKPGVLIPAMIASMVAEVPLLSKRATDLQLRQVAETLERELAKRSDKQVLESIAAAVATATRESRGRFPAARLLAGLENHASADFLRDKLTPSPAEAGMVAPLTSGFVPHGPASREDAIALAERDGVDSCDAEISDQLLLALGDSANAGRATVVLTSELRDFMGGRLASSGLWRFAELLGGYAVEEVSAARAEFVALLLREVANGNRHIFDGLTFHLSDLPLSELERLTLASAMATTLATAPNDFESEIEDWKVCEHTYQHAGAELVRWVAKQQESPVSISAAQEAEWVSLLGAASAAYTREIEKLGMSGT